MKKINLLIGILFGITLFACSSDNKEETIRSTILNGDLILFSQQDVDDFLEFNYTEINGSVLIQGSDITNVEPLKSIITIRADLSIFNNESSLDLSGLRNVSSVGAELAIIENQGDINLSGLINIETVGGHFIIESNPYLTSLEGIGSVEIQDDLTVKNNDSLISLNGLENVKSYSYCVIQDNTNLYDLCALLHSISLNQHVLYYISNNINNISASSLNTTNCSI